MSDNVVQLSDLIEQRLRKQQEIDYYQNTLKHLESRIQYLQKEVDITSLIIDLIDNEKLLLFDKRKEKISAVIGLVDKKDKTDD